MTDDLHRDPTPAECVEAAARERLAQAIQEGRQPQGTVWDGHYLTAAKAILTAAGVPALLAALDRERQRTRKGVRTPAPGYESGYVSGNVHAAACQERDEARQENEWLRERVASLMLEEPSKTAGLYAAIDELQAATQEGPPKRAPISDLADGATRP